MNVAVKSTMECPNCKSQIPYFKNEVSWCDLCDWNVDPIHRSEVENVFERFTNSLGRKISEDIYHSVLSRKISKPLWTRTKILTVAIASLVVFGPAVLVLFNIYAYFIFPKLIFYIFLIVTVGFGFLAYSKPRKKPEGIVDQAQFPRLYQLVNRICQYVGNYEVAGVALISDFNAFYTEMGSGPYKKRYISLGVPLLEILTDDEIVALISHEASHGANGDILRMSLLWRAQHILSESFYVFAPKHSHEGVDAIRTAFLLVLIMNYIFLFIAQVPLGCWKLMRKLSMRDSQEAEYYADLVATQVCGKSAMASLLKKLRYFDEYDLAVGKLAIEKKDYDFFAELKKLTTFGKSQRTIDRLNRLEKLKGLSLDSTHPPTVLRIDVIEKNGADVASIPGSSYDIASVREEIESIKKKLISELLDARLRTLFG